MEDEKRVEENIVQDYLFADEAEAELARSEVKKITYIEERMDYKNIKMIYNFYMNCIENKVFVTPIGYAYLEKTRKYILAKGYSSDILPIPVASNNHMAKREINKEKKKYEQLVKEKGKMVDRRRISFILNIVLFILVIAMFLIAGTSDRPNIINYEKVIINKYASWEEELSEREDIVREKELELFLNDEN